MYRRIFTHGGSLVPQGEHSLVGKVANPSSVQHTFRAASWRHAITADGASPSTYNRNNKATQQSTSIKKEVPAFVSSFRLALSQFTTLSTPSFMSAANPERRSRQSAIDEAKKRELVLEEKAMISGFLGKTKERGNPDYSMSAFQKCWRRQAGKTPAPLATESSSASALMNKDSSAERDAVVNGSSGTNGSLTCIPDSTYALREEYMCTLDGKYATFNHLVGNGIVLLYFYAFWGDAFCTVTPSVVSLMDNINASLQDAAGSVDQDEGKTGKRLPVKSVKLAMVNMDLHEHLSALHDLRSVPTFVIYANGSIVGRVEGTVLEPLNQKINEVVASL